MDYEDKSILKVYIYVNEWSDQKTKRWNFEFQDWDSKKHYFDGSIQKMEDTIKWRRGVQWPL